jgi:hypothetical protein
VEFYRSFTWPMLQEVKILKLRDKEKNKRNKSKNPETKIISLEIWRTIKQQLGGIAACKGMN